MKTSRNIVLVSVLGALVVSGCANKKTPPPLETSAPISEIRTTTATVDGVDFDGIYSMPTEVITDEVAVTDSVAGYYDENGNFIAYDSFTGDFSAYDYSAASEIRYSEAGIYTGTLETRVIYFNFNDDSISDAAYSSLKAHAEYLSQNPSARLRLEGHADERGTRDYNVALSERRSNSVERYLQIQGVLPSQLEVISYGEEKPAEFGSDEQAWSKNRRVELVYSTDAP